MNHEPRGPEMRPSGWRLRKACVGWLWRERKPNLSEPAYARSIEQVFDGAACVRRFGNLLNAASILQVQSCIKRYWCAMQSNLRTRGGVVRSK